MGGFRVENILFLAAIAFLAVLLTGAEAGPTRDCLSCAGDISKAVEDCAVFHLMMNTHFCNALKMLWYLLQTVLSVFVTSSHPSMEWILNHVMEHFNDDFEMFEIG